MEFVDANTYNCAITRLLLKKIPFFTHFDYKLTIRYKNWIKFRLIFWKKERNMNQVNWYFYFEI